MWHVKNEGAGPIVLTSPDIKIDANSTMDLDKVSDRATLERSRSLTVALNKGYLVELEKTVERQKETVVVEKQQAPPPPPQKDMTGDLNNMKSDIIGQLSELINKQKENPQDTQNDVGVTLEDLEKFKSSLVGEVKEIVKSNPVVVNQSDSSGKVQRPQNVKVVDKDELELRKGFVADVAKEFKTEEKEFGKQSKDKSNVNESVNELEDLLK